jgi:hypothetical protein
MYIKGWAPQPAESSTDESKRRQDADGYSKIGIIRKEGEVNV